MSETDKALLKQLLPPGCSWSGVIGRGMGVTFTDLEGHANLSALFYNADDFLEKYNMPDTLKAQFTSFITDGRVLFSDMGRILCSVIADDTGWHDTIGGLSDAKTVLEKYGNTSYQDHRNERSKNGYDTMLVELGKHGLGEKDLAANVNFFSRLVVDERGDLAFQRAEKPGTSVSLRMEMNVLVVLANCPHPMAPAGNYLKEGTGTVQMTVKKAKKAGINDPCRRFRPENERGFINTENYLALLGS